MPRPNLIRSDHHPYHITARCNNKQFFPLPLFEMWEIFMSHLYFIHREFGVGIHSFVLMGNHFHLLCHTPQGNIDEVMMRLMKRTSDEVNRRTNSVNHLWGTRYKWSVIQARPYYYQVYKYIYQNPLRAKIVDKVENYPFSTLVKKSPFPLHSFLPFAFGGSQGELAWINDIFQEKQSSAIRAGLRKGTFELSQPLVNNHLRIGVSTRKRVSNDRDGL